jgi:hypothetical protein
MFPGQQIHMQQKIAGCIIFYVEHVKIKGKYAISSSQNSFLIIIITSKYKAAGIV